MFCIYFGVINFSEVADRLIGNQSYLCHFFFANNRYRLVIQNELVSFIIPLILFCLYNKSADIRQSRARCRMNKKNYKDPIKLISCTVTCLLLKQLMTHALLEKKFFLCAHTAEKRFTNILDYITTIFQKSFTTTELYLKCLQIIMTTSF